MIGPEGGFTGAEITSIADSGGKLISLGIGVLRVETAAIALLAYLTLGRGG
jgi:16S rRNA (uracil1498-N3)-methyltransferase